MKIITLTLSPAFDVHCLTEDLRVGHENLAKIIRREAGGKGVNISRALKVNDTESLSVVLLGSENGDDFEKYLLADGLNSSTITVSGRIRENITLHTSSGEETRISFEGFSADPSVLDKIRDKLDKIQLDGVFVTLTGRAPSGIDMLHIKNFLKHLRQRGARLIIDSRSFSLADLAECSPYLIKPNQEEISTHMGKEISTLAEAIEAARAIHGQGIENVMITLGDKGAALVSDNGVWTAIPPRIEAISTIGAGDSSIAGFLYAVSEELDEGQALRRAVAFGTAACLTEGTLPPRKEDIEKINSQIKLNRM